MSLFYLLVFFGFIWWLHCHNTGRPFFAAGKANPLRSQHVNRLKQKRFTQSKNHKPPTSAIITTEAVSETSKAHNPPPDKTEAFPHRLAYKLDGLTRDSTISKRLVDKIASNNPDKSLRWCYEKAIFDLERDRL